MRYSVDDAIGPPLPRSRLSLAGDVCAAASLYYKLHRPEDGARERKIVDQITAAGPGSSGSAGIQGK
ncbi:MAG: hypothetical protein ACYCSN_07765 [Acidobacteriaceae bacterium]